jgi:hypothetical protein
MGNAFTARLFGEEEIRISSRIKRDRRRATLNLESGEEAF